MSVKNELEGWVEPEKPKKKRAKWRIFLMLFTSVALVVNIALYLMIEFDIL